MATWGDTHDEVCNIELLHVIRSSQYFPPSPSACLESLQAGPEAQGATDAMTYDMSYQSYHQGAQQHRLADAAGIVQG